MMLGGNSATGESAISLIIAEFRFAEGANCSVTVRITKDSMVWDAFHWSCVIRDRNLDQSEFAGEKKIIGSSEFIVYIAEGGTSAFWV